jgi:hypothetical protein
MTTLAKYSVQIASVLGIVLVVITQHFAGAWWLPMVSGAAAVLGIHASTFVAGSSTAPASAPAPVPAAVLAEMAKLAQEVTALQAKLAAPSPIVQPAPATAAGM